MRKIHTTIYTTPGRYEITTTKLDDDAGRYRVVIEHGGKQRDFEWRASSIQRAHEIWVGRVEAVDGLRLIYGYN